MEKTKKKVEPKVKADNRVEFEGLAEPEDFTNFEMLLKEMEILKEMVNLNSEILSQNHLIKKEKTEADTFDDNEVFKRLEAEE